MKRIVIATKNPGKLREMKDAFRGLPIEILSLTDFGELPDAVEDGATFAENASIKARFFREKTGLACLADDSGLEVEALNGGPGVHSARFAGYHADDDANNKKLLDELEKIGIKKSKADYRCVLSFIDVDGSEIQTDGVVFGTIKAIPKGVNGFGYDPYFYIDEVKTMAEISLEEKDKISHRGAALRKMVSKLKERLS